VLSTPSPVWLFDVDNTLLDNDRFGADLAAHLEQTFGAQQRDRYWSLYAAVRDETGYADYLAALQRFRVGLEDEARLLHVGEFILDYPFADRLYPRALDVVAACASHGPNAVVFSDGDIVFQPRKIVRSGLWEAFDGRVLVCVHKERSLDRVQRNYPAAHYAIVDDKPRLLAAIKRALGPLVTTIFVRQGHYAAEATTSVIEPAPDVTLDRIGDVIDLLTTPGTIVAGGVDASHTLSFSNGLP
jgi:FMN phosphatase YigB (HAD superfamily)